MSNPVRLLVDRRTFLAVLIVLTLIVALVRVQYLTVLAASGGGMDVAIAFDPDELAAAPYVHDAYEAYFRANGVPHEWISVNDVQLLSSADLVREFRAIVFPDRIAQRIGDPLMHRISDYAAAGGHVVIAQDAGEKDTGGFFRRNGLFEPLTGVRYMNYDANAQTAFVRAPMQFRSRATSAKWGFPYGKIDNDGYVTGYLYGRLLYNLNNASVSASDVSVPAHAGSIPVIATRNVGNGESTYINLPLGALKASGDSLPMQALLDTTLLARAAVPHLVAAPDGIGRVIVDVHIDSDIELAGVPHLERSHLLRSGVPFEFDVTAGPDLAFSGDGRGFDACGKGRTDLQLLEHYGAIGDGGWAHNSFAAMQQGGAFDAAAVRRMIGWNSKCLSSVTGKPVVSYAASAGIHPQPTTTRILSSLGIIGYYYDGDSGAPALLPFYNRSLASMDVWAFPIMPLGTMASIGEMADAHVPPATVGTWLDRTLAFASGERSIQLLYSHAYDFALHPEYDGPFAAFLDQVQRMQRDGSLYATTMPDAARFLRRYSRTSFSATNREGKLAVDLANPEGLQQIAFALPKNTAPVARRNDLQVAFRGSDTTYNYYSVRANVTRLHLVFAQ